MAAAAETLHVLVMTDDTDPRRLASATYSRTNRTSWPARSTSWWCRQQVRRP
jgi:hypothetical protein